MWAATVSMAAAESPSMLLQKGIFAEETERNLDTAIKIYQQITADAAANRSVVAQAQYRLGVCYQKKGNKDQAISALKDLLKQFPTEAALGQKARELLAGLGHAPSSDVAIRKVPLAVAKVFSISPDGRLVAYRPQEDSSLVIHETTTGKSWTAIQGGKSQSVRNALISPDGSRLAYQFSDRLVALHVARIDGTEAKEVGATREGEWYAWIYAWSPDGRQLIVEYSAGGDDSVSVGTLDVESGMLKEVKRYSPAIRLGELCISASGRHLAYRVGAGSEKTRKIVVLDLESGTETTLIDKEVRFVVGWAPGDARLLFLSDRTGTAGLWAIAVQDGKPAGEPKLVKPSVGEIWPCAVTSNGSIYYTESTSSEYVYVGAVNFETGEISGEPHCVTPRFPGSQAKPVWSKDGRRMMLCVQRQGLRGFVAVSLASGELKDFPVSDTFTTPLQQYAWSPDEKFLLVQSVAAEGGMGIHRYELNSGETKTLVKQVEGANWCCHPRFSPDGSAFYYARREFTPGGADWKDCIVRRDLLSGNEQIVHASPDKLQIWWPFELSPDGQRMAIVVSDEFQAKDFVVALKVRAVNGSETKELVRMAPRENVISLAWTPDGKRLVYTKKRPGKENEVWVAAVDSGQSVQLQSSLPRLRDVAVHPDGRQLAFLAGSSGGQDLWVMEGLMPKPIARDNGTVMRRVSTNAPGVGGVLTPDGKHICHIDGATGDTVQYEIASGQTRRITNTGGSEAKETPYEYQAFSRDGKRVAYDSYTKDSVAQLRLRNLDGSGLRTLYSEKGYHVRPLDWSPDGGYILASRELEWSSRGGRELTLISTADGSVRVLKSVASSWPSRARFSPDGQSIAFSLMGGSPPNGEVFLMTADGRNEVGVAKHPADDQLLGWTADGRSLLFFSDRGGTRDIWIVFIGGGKQQGEPELLKKDLGQDSMVLGLAPDGSLYYQAHTASGRLYTGELDLETGKVLVPLALVATRYTTPAIQLTWSPDGTKLAYLSHPGRVGFGNNILTIRSAATGEERFLSPALRGVNQISWAPDGRGIITLGFTATEASAFRIDTQTSAITKLRDRAVFPHLCPDGKTLVFLGEGGIRKRNLDTGEETEVVKTDRPFGVSPDGREVAFQEGGVVKTVSLNGGEPREVYRSSAEGYSLRWTQDGRYIIARVFSENHEVWRIPAGGGTPLKLDLPKLLFFALHPDNRRFALSIYGEGKSELWVLENFLPKGKEAGK